MISASKFILVGILLVFVSSALGHSYLTKPISRSNQKQTNTGCRGPACLGPCDVMKSQARTPAVTIQRGATINTQWPRNNHAGGFIRFAWAKTDESDVHASFDSNVQQIGCHEVGGCKPDDPSNPNGGDSGPSDGSSQPCQTTITVPLHLTDGAWTLQWAWFGGAFALGDYYSCVDYVISGGPTGDKIDAVFKGGDYSHPGQNKCKFFNTDRLHQCVNEPCNAAIFPNSQEQAGVAFGISSGSNTPVTTAAATTAKAPVIPSTTGKNTPSTTGKQAAATTAQAAPSTTASAPVIPSTTGAPSSGGDGNCAGESTLSDSFVTIAAVNQWGNTFQIVIQLHVQEEILSDWMVEVIWPNNADRTSVLRTYNGGILQCQSNTPNNHAMLKPASWANNLHKGEVNTIEIQASNSNMSNDFIKANTRFKVYKN